MGKFAFRQLSIIERSNPWHSVTTMTGYSMSFLSLYGCGSLSMSINMLKQNAYLASCNQMLFIR